MGFDDLKPQTSINARADAYAAESLRRSRTVAEHAPCLLDVSYGSDPSQTIDIYFPRGSITGAPVLLFFHGGNFTHGYKEWCGFMAPAFTSLPAIFVSVSYRLLGETSYPAAIGDGLAALAYVSRTISEYGGDPDHIFIGGHSAGGHIVALMGLRPDWRRKAGVGDNAVKGVFSMSATYSMRMIGDAAVPDSPLEHARSAIWPFHLTWASGDKEVVRISGRQMADALKEAGVEVFSAELPERDHFTIHSRTEDPNDEWTKHVRQWMTR